MDNKEAIMETFETKCQTLQHKQCSSCKAVGLFLEVGKSGRCSRCTSYDDNQFPLQSLPIWYDDSNNVQYNQPPELKELTIAEKMLIQQVSPFVPLQHIKNGVFGLAGHVCCFEQDIEGFVSTLPRKKEDAMVLKGCKSVQCEIGSEIEAVKTFMVNKRKVLAALHWLKKNNSEYRNIHIDPSHPDWIEGEAGQLAASVPVPDGLSAHEKEMIDINVDAGPNPSETKEQMKKANPTSQFGYLNNNPQVNVSETDKIIQKELRAAINDSDSSRTASIAWPSISEEPVNEYGNKKVFALAFPWLFPGGFSSRYQWDCHPFLGVS